MNGIKKTQFINKNQAQQLHKLARNQRLTPAYGQRRRVGEKGLANLSQYSYSKQNRWNADLNAAFETIIDDDIKQHCLQASILKIAKGGLLDKQNAWTGERTADTVPVIAGFMIVALKDQQALVINEQSRHYNAGDCVFFDLEMAHEIKKTSKDNYWLVLMLSKPFIKRHLDAQ